MRSCSTGRSNGFTIVEVLVALAIAGVGLLAVFQAMGAASDAAERISNEEQAQMVAENHMTAVLSKPLGQMGTKTGEEGKFAWTEQIRASKNPKLAEVVILVRWQQKGKEHEFGLVSLKVTQ